MVIFGGIGAAGDFPRLGMTSLIFGLGLGGRSIYSWWKNRQPKISFKDFDEDKAELLRENFEKAVTDFRYLQTKQGHLHDREMNAHLTRMQKTAKNLILHLENHPERIPLAYKFIDYYQDRAVKIVQQYQDLEETELSTDKVRDLKERMKSTLAALDEAYAEQFEHILNDQMLSVEAELKVMEQQLDAEGIKRSDVIDIGELDADGKIAESTEALEYEYTPYNKQLGRKHRPRSIRPPIDLNNLSVIPEGERSRVIQRKIIQSALAIFFGSFGAHKFYQSKTFWGILYFVFCWTTIPAWLGMLEGIRYLFMPIDDFYLQYVQDDDYKKYLQFDKDYNHKH